MRRYREIVRCTEEVEKIVCNRCGKEITVEGGVPSGEVLTVDKSWGYFSKKDGRRDRFDLCEDCYDEIVKGFRIPVETEETL